MNYKKDFKEFKNKLIYECGYLGKKFMKWNKNDCIKIWKKIKDR